MHTRSIIAVLALWGALPASPQAAGEAHAVFIRGGDYAFRFTGLAAGGGILFHKRFGLGGEIGLTGDNSPERDVFPVLSAGGTVHFPSAGETRALIPFVAAGFTTLAGRSGGYAGGGVNYWFHSKTAFRFEFQGLVPAASANARKAWFLRAGFTFG